MIAELVLSEKSVKDVANEYSLRESLVRNWSKQKAPIDVEGNITSLEDILKIKKENARLKPVNTMCTILDYPRSTYYDKLKGKPKNKWEKENRKLQEDTLRIYNDSNKIYGAPKIHAKLKTQDYEDINLKRVQRHMKKLGIKSIVVKKV